MTDDDLGSSKLISPIVSATGEVSDPLYSLLRQAVNERATDIHLDPLPDGKLVRFRVDGLIYRKYELKEEIHRRILTQVKVAAGFSIARAFTPEEGMIVFKHEEPEPRYYIRVSTAPSGLDRVAIHFRFLIGKDEPLNFSELGMSKSQQEQINAVLDSPSGIILIAGVTGSGKSSTLYAIANAMDLDKNIVVSIEDPIEMRVPGMRQIEVIPNHNFEMYDGLRTILRMDPDAIFVGEIRDTRSAITAARAGLAGRLVVSTVHASNPATALEALHHYDVPSYITASAMRLIITQYLLRRVCTLCGVKRIPTPEEASLFTRYELSPPEYVTYAKGCESCQYYGYIGRIGVFELTKITDEVVEDISIKLDKVNLLKRFRQLCGPSFMVDALNKVAAGTITIADATQLYLNVEKR